MSAHNGQEMVCPICGKKKTAIEFMPAEMIRPVVVEIIRKEHPEFKSNDYICLDDLTQYRTKYVEHVLETDKGELSEIEKEVVDSLAQHELLSKNINEEFTEQLTFGQRLADKVSTFGGSWKLIIFFAMVMLVWIGINVVSMLWKPFDPYPFILLNLVLSCLAALQAPIIMMSQNRQEVKDRFRAENDYRINLKAELEIRQLHQKMDHLLLRQWHRLLEVQQIQIQIMEEFSHRQKNSNA